jgi:hypothetical protein
VDKVKSVTRFLCLHHYCDDLRIVFDIVWLPKTLLWSRQCEIKIVKIIKISLINLFTYLIYENRYLCVYIMVISFY